MKRRVLSDLLIIHHPGDYLREVLTVCDLNERKPESAIVTNAYRMAFRLYRGEFKGYLGYDTNYHDGGHFARRRLHQKIERVPKRGRAPSFRA